MTKHITSRLFLLDQGELAFLQKVSRAEYHFITNEEQTARQFLRDKLNEVVLNARENKIALNLTADDLAFLASAVLERISAVTPKEREARQVLGARLDAAARSGISG